MEIISGHSISSLPPRWWYSDADEAETRATTRKLLDLAAREGVRLIVHGRDANQWPTLRKAPAYHD
jgi:hypothetical protein